MAIVIADVNQDAERFRLTVPGDLVMVESMQGVTAAVDAHPGEDLVVIGPEVPMRVATDVAERYRAERPSLGVVLIRHRVEVQSMADAMRAGVREVVSSNDAEALRQACIRSSAVSRQLRSLGTRSDDARRAHVILVFGAKGGCGKTTLATNLAAALASLDVGRVCLMDMNLEFGDVALAIQADPVRTISDALGMQGELDSDGVRSLVVNAGERLDLLLAPRSPADAEFISADLVGSVISNLAQTYAFVVIDSPPAFSDAVLKAFDLADAYVLLTTLDMLALRALKVTLETLDALGYPRSRWRVVLNRHDSHVGLTPEDIEQVIGTPIQVRLPSSKDVPASLNSGVPIVRANPRHPFSRAVIQLAREESEAATAHLDEGPEIAVRRGWRMRQRARA